VYAKHPELNKPQLRQEASASVTYLPIRSLTLSANGSYRRTQTPSDLNITTGIEETRNQAKSYSFSPSARYEINPLTSIGSNYNYTRDKEDGGTKTDTNTASIDLARRITGQDTGTLAYSYRHYQFNEQESSETSGGGNTTISHVGSLAWSHNFTALTSLTLRGGARYSDGSVTPDVSASISHRLQQGQISFSYARSQTTAIGHSGTINTESFSAAASYQPSRFLTLSASPAYSKNDQQDSDSRVYSLGLNATYQLTSWLNLVGSHRFSFQEGELSDTSGGGGTNQNILRNITMLQLVLNYPYRVD
jgi:hypothetical protein